jgi:hypothetical protein
VESVGKADSPTPASSTNTVTWTTDSTGSLVTYKPEDEPNKEPNKDEQNKDDQTAPKRPEVHDGEDENVQHRGGWWAWFEAKFGDAKDWAAAVFHKGDGDDKEDKHE